MSLIIDYPWYFVLLCATVGVAYSVLLYFVGRRRRKASGKPEPFGRGITWILSALRTLSVWAIAMLLLSPMVKRDSTRKEKPLIVIAEDNSKSPDYCPDSAYYHNDFQKELSNVVNALSADYEVVRLHYGASVTEAVNDTLPLFGGQSTDMAKMLSEILERYYHRNIGALVVTGDGIYNSGQNPLTVASNLPYPVYTVAMGDTTIHRDASISNVRFNRIAYAGNSFPMDITVHATRLRGETTNLTISRDGQKVYGKQLTIDDNNYTTVESVTLDAGTAGVHNYVVEVSPLNGEQTLRNNRRIISVEIIDGHQKIAIIAAAPHPDVGALRRSIEQNQNYEVESFTATEWNKNPRDYDLLILHQLPAKQGVASFDVSRLLADGTPALFVIGSQSDLARLNALHAGLEIHSRIDRQNEVTALVDKNFTFFTLDDNVKNDIERFPPLTSPFGEYKTSGNTQTLLKAKLGSVNSGLPLVAMTEQQGRRYTFIAGEGLWRWRLAEYQVNASYRSFDELINKIVIFTALQANKDKFHVELKSVYSETEEVVAEAQLYNDNYEPVNSAEVEFILQRRGADATGRQQYRFNQAGTGYRLNLGTLPAGAYSYSATAKLGGKAYNANGNFVVEDLHIEAVNLVADHSLLNTMSTTTGGVMIEAHQVGQLPQLLKQRDDIKTVIYSETRYSDLLNLVWVFVAIMLLLTVEWVVRKTEGEV